MRNIEKGYVLIARQLYESKIMKMPPHFREIWLWLIQRANHIRKKVGGRWIERGSALTSYAEIIEGLSWYVGYRKMTYKKHHCEKAMKGLTKAGMVATTKATRGFLVTICNYDIYQNPNNYVSDNVSVTKAMRERQSSDTINKNGKNGKNGRMEKKKKAALFTKPTPQEVSDYAKGIGFDLDGERFCDYYQARGWELKRGQPMKDWMAAVRTWKKNNLNRQQQEDLGSVGFCGRNMTDEDKEELGWPEDNQNE